MLVSLIYTIIPVKINITHSNIRQVWQKVPLLLLYCSLALLAADFALAVLSVRAVSASSSTFPRYLDRQGESQPPAHHIQTFQACCAWVAEYMDSRGQTHHSVGPMNAQQTYITPIKHSSQHLSSAVQQQAMQPHAPTSYLQGCFEAPLQRCCWLRPDCILHCHCTGFQLLCHVDQF